MFGELKFNTAHWLKLKINKLYIQKQIFTDFEMALQTLLSTSRANRWKNVVTKFVCNAEASLKSTFYYRFKRSDVCDVRGWWCLCRYCGVIPVHVRFYFVWMVFQAPFYYKFCYVFWMIKIALLLFHLLHSTWYVTFLCHLSYYRIKPTPRIMKLKT